MRPIRGYWFLTLVVALVLEGVMPSSPRAADTIQAMLDALPPTGGEVRLPAGTFDIRETLVIGRGAEGQDSSVNDVVLSGAGMGGHSALSDTSSGGTRLRWVGDPGGTMMRVDGPIRNVRIRDLQLDGNNQAWVGLVLVHPTQSLIERVSVVNYMWYALWMTTRTTVPAGVHHGACQNRIEQFYSYGPATIQSHGIKLTGFLGGEGTPDSCLNTFSGGIVSYGGGFGSFGVELEAADNNIFQGMLILPRSDGSGGCSVYLHQDAVDPTFPKENWFASVVLKQPTCGGSQGRNLFGPFQASDGGSIVSGNSNVILY